MAISTADKRAGWRWVPNALTGLRMLLALGVGAALVQARLEIDLLPRLAEDLNAFLNAAARAARRGDAPPALWAALPVLLFTLAAATDALDGYAARKLDAHTALGARLDPIADKLLAAATLIPLCWALGWPWDLTLPAAAIVSRDLVVTVLRERGGQPKALAVSALAKVKTAAELTGVGLALAALALGVALSGLRGAGPVAQVAVSWSMMTGYALIWIAAALSLITGYRYTAALRNSKP